jgi:hypothetical protein
MALDAPVFVGLAFQVLAMRRFIEKTRNSLSRKPQLTTCDEAALDAEEAERLLQAGVVVFEGTEVGLDETAGRLQDEDRVPRLEREDGHLLRRQQRRF